MRHRPALSALVVGAIILITSTYPAVAQPKMKTLGTDPQLDAPPPTDVTRLDVGSDGVNLVVRIATSAMLPELGTVPGAGIEWTFDVGRRTFVAEGHPEPGAGFSFTLFEVASSSFREVAKLDGELDWMAGTMTMEVPLALIGARRGTKISGNDDAPDVDIHLHAGPASRVMDDMATTKDFVIP